MNMISYLLFSLENRSTEVLVQNACVLKIDFCACRHATSIAVQRYVVSLATVLPITESPTGRTAEMETTKRYEVG